MSKTLGEAQKARNSGIKVMVISVGSNNNINQEVIDGFKLTTLVVIGTDCIGSYKSNYNTITTTTAPHNVW
jgi:hypothetical protein